LETLVRPRGARRLQGYSPSGCRAPVLAVSESSFTEITEYNFISLLQGRAASQY